MTTRHLIVGNVSPFDVRKCQENVAVRQNAALDTRQEPEQLHGDGNSETT